MANDAAAPSTLQYVRTVLAPQYRVTPMANAAVDGAGPAEDDVKFFFDFEQQVLRGAEERARAADADEHATTQALERLEDIDEATLRRLPQARSLDKAHFKLAISMLGSDASYDMLKQFCDSIEHLKSMGFKEHVICGALLKHGGDVNAAISSCLDCDS